MFVLVLERRGGAVGLPVEHLARLSATRKGLKRHFYRLLRRLRGVRRIGKVRNVPRQAPFHIYRCIYRVPCCTYYGYILYIQNVY